MRRARISLAGVALRAVLYTALMPETKLSVFLSGTRRDLPGFWPAAKDALVSAFPDFIISMMEDAEPEDIPGDHWSRREATKPDVLVGLVGRYYGKVLRNQERSLTEQEFDVAGQVGINRLMFTTESCAPGVLAGQAVEDRERVERFRARIDGHVVRRGIAGPDDFAKHVVEAVRQWERRTLRGALQDAKVYFSPLLDPAALFSHTEPLVGQAEILADLEAFCSSTKRIFVFHAPWGRGKSRVLLELAGRVEHVRFLRDDIPLTRQHLNISAADPVVLVIDDLQRRDEIQLLQLLAFLQRCGPEVKLLAASRTSRVGAFLGLTRQQGIPAISVVTKELPALTDAQQHDLVAQVFGGKNDLTNQVVIRTRGSVLAALLAARMIRRGQTTFGDLDRNPDFVAEVLGRFQDALLLAPDLDAGVRESLKAVLQLIAICGPVRPGASEQREAMAQFLGRQPEEISREVELLEDRGLLLRRGGLVTIPIDAVRETEALRACVTSRGELTGLAERALRELTGAFRGNLLRNLALVDFRAEQAGHTTSLLDQVWPEIEAAYDAMPASQRLPLLRDLKDVAPFQPQAALRFVRHALPSGLGPPETDELHRHFGPLPVEYLYDALAQILRGTLYHPDCVREACDLLWQMARDDQRPAPQHTDCAERALVDLAKLDPYRPLDCYESFLGWAEAKVAAGEVPGYRLANYLEPLLEKELERGYADEGAMHFWAEPPSVEGVRPFHDRALLLLDRLARSGDLRASAAAISTIGHALRPPGGAFGRRITPAELAAWEPEQLQALAQLRSLATAREDRVIDLCVLRTVDGVARYSEQEELRRSAVRLKAELMGRLEMSIELALMPHWSPPWDHGDGSEEAHRRTVASTAEHITSTIPDAEVVIREVRGAYDRLAAARIDSQAWTLLNELTRRTSAIGVCFLDAVLDGDDEIAEHAGGALSVFFESEPPMHLDLLDRAVTRGRTHVHRAVARGYFSTRWRSAAGQERFLGHVRALLESEDPVTRIETLRALRFAKELPVEARAGVLLNYDPSRDPPQADMWAIAVNDIYPQLTAGQRRGLVARLERLPSLGYFDDRILERLCADEPMSAVDMLLARVKHADEEHYEVVPSRGGSDRDPLAPIPGSERERALRALGPLLSHESFRIQHAAQELFARLGGSEPAVRRRVRLAWVESDDPDLILAAAQSFRRERSTVLFDEEDVVVRLLNAARDSGGETERLAKSELLAASSVEVRHGSASDSDYLDAQIRDRSRTVAAKYPPGSPGRTFYTDLAAQAQSMIDVLIQREQELGLER